MRVWRWAGVATLLFSGCSSEPVVVAAPEVGDGPSHALLFEFVNGGERSVEIEVWLDDALVIEGSVPDRGGNHCWSITGPLSLEVAEGVHTLEVEPSYAVVPLSLDVREDSWVTVSIGDSALDDDVWAFLAPGPFERGCR